MCADSLNQKTSSLYYRVGDILYVAQAFVLMRNVLQLYYALLISFIRIKKNKES